MIYIFKKYIKSLNFKGKTRIHHLVDTNIIDNELVLILILKKLPRAKETLLEALF